MQKYYVLSVTDHSPEVRQVRSESHLPVDTTPTKLPRMTSFPRLVRTVLSVCVYTRTCAQAPRLVFTKIKLHHCSTFFPVSTHILTSFFLMAAEYSVQMDYLMLY